MARQKGIVPLEGTIGGINYYSRKGEALAREAGGGFNGEDIRKSPKMVRVRENSSEFGMVSTAKKLVKLGLHPFLMDFNDGTLHGRMMSVFHKIKLLDTVSVRGQRRFENGLATDEGCSLLLDFAFTAKKASVMLPGKGLLDLDTQQYTVSGIDIANLQLPKGATGMQLCFGILQVDFAGETYKFFSSDKVFIDANFNDNSLTLDPDTLPSSNGVRIAVLQVRYYQEVNGKRFLFKDLVTQALEVVGVY